MKLCKKMARWLDQKEMIIGAWCVAYIPCGGIVLMGLYWLYLFIFKHNS